MKFVIVLRVFRFFGLEFGACPGRAVDVVLDGARRFNRHVKLGRQGPRGSARISLVLLGVNRPGTYDAA